MKGNTVERIVENYCSNKYLQMSGPGEGGAGPTELADCDDLVAQRGRVRRLREAGAADYEVRPAVKGLELLLRSVIREQGGLVRRLSYDTAGEAHYEEAVARLEALKAEFQEVSGKVWREEGPTSAEIGDQRARLTRLREEGADEYEVRKAVSKLRSLLRELILAEIFLVMELRSTRAGWSAITAAERRLTSLKAQFLADTGEEWSEVRGEGPIFLTTNQVRGNEIIPELGETVKQLRAENILG